MKFIHTSDVHLFATPDQEFEWGKNRTKEIEDTFERILDDCNSKDVDLLIIAGNLFDHSPSVEDLQFLDNKLQNLTKTRTVILAGNVDYIETASEQANFKFASRTVLLPPGKTTNAYLRGINTCVTGFSYDRPEIGGRVLETIDPGRAGAINILIGCGGDKQHMPYEKEILARKGFDYVAMGYMRKPVHILRNRMAYSGSPEPISHVDTGRHGYIYGEINDEGTFVTFCPVAKRSYMKIDVTLNPNITNSEITHDIETKLMKLGNDNIYTLAFRGFAGDDIDPDFTRIRNRFNIYDVVNMTITKRDEKTLREENETNMMGSFIREVKGSYTIDDNLRQKALRYGMEALIMAGDKDECI